MDARSLYLFNEDMLYLSFEQGNMRTVKTTSGLRDYISQVLSFVNQTIGGSALPYKSRIIWRV